MNFPFINPDIPANSSHMAFDVILRRSLRLSLVSNYTIVHSRYRIIWERLQKKVIFATVCGLWSNGGKNFSGLIRLIFLPSLGGKEIAEVKWKFWTWWNWMYLLFTDSKWILFRVVIHFYNLEKSFLRKYYCEVFGKLFFVEIGDFCGCIFSNPESYVSNKVHEEFEILHSITLWKKIIFLTLLNECMFSNPWVSKFSRQKL